MYSSLWETHCRTTEHHLPYGILQCYLPPDTGEYTLLSCLSQAGRYSIYLLRRDGRLSWPWRWLYTIPTWFTCSQTVTHPSSNKQWRNLESYSRPLSHESDVVALCHQAIVILICRSMTAARSAAAVAATSSASRAVSDDVKRRRPPMSTTVLDISGVTLDESTVDDKRKMFPGFYVYFLMGFSRAS